MFKALITLSILLLPLAAQCQFTQTVDGREVLILTHPSQVDKSLQKAGDVEVESKAFKKKSFAEQLKNMGAEAIKLNTNIVLITHCKSNSDGSSCSMQGIAYKATDYEQAKATAMAEKNERAKGDGVVRFYRFDIKGNIKRKANLKVDGKKIVIMPGETVDVPVTTAHSMRMKYSAVKKFRDVKPGEIYYVNVFVARGAVNYDFNMVTNSGFFIPMIPIGTVDKDLLLRGEWYGEIEYNLGMRQ